MHIPSGRQARALEDLAYGAHLAPFSGTLAPQGDHDCVRLSDLTLDQPDSGGARFLESVFTSVSVTGGRFRRTRFSDVWSHTVRFVGTDLTDTQWVDCDLIGCALAGLQMHGVQLRNVVFSRCKFDVVNLRGARLQDVAFTDCVLRDVDLGEAVLEGVRFSGCALAEMRLRGARLADVDLRGCALDIADGVEFLRGATISPEQLIDLAPALAAVLGLRVQ